VIWVWPLSVHTQWIHEQGLFLSATDERGIAVPGELLARWLLTWDEESFYGTLAPLTEVADRRGVLFSAERALQYVLAPKFNTQIQWRWPSAWENWRTMAEQLRVAIEAGRIQPDFAAWQQGVLQWSVRPQAATDIPVEGEAATLSKSNDIPYEAQWTDAVIRAKATRMPGLASKMAAIAAELALRQPDIAEFEWESEADWLSELGLIDGARKPRPGLRLCEPVDGETWALQVVLLGGEDYETLQAETVAPSVSVYSLADAAIVTDSAALTEQDGATQPPKIVAALQRQVQLTVRRWLRIVPWLAETATSDRLRTTLTTDEAWLFLTDAAVTLAGVGCPVLLPPWWEEVRRTSARLKAHVQSAPAPSGGHAADESGAGGMGLAQILEFDWRVAVGSVELTEREFRSLLERQSQLVQVQGRWVQIDPAFYRRALAAMTRLGSQRGLSLQEVLSRYWLAGDSETGGDSPVVSVDGKLEGEAARRDQERALEQSAFSVEIGAALSHWLAGLHDAAIRAEPELPPAHSQHLRPYQRRGVAWLLYLRSFGLGACLADDMGLGKTVQFIAYLATVLEREPTSGPCLLICPMSVVGNWQKEWARFAPHIKVQVHHGAQRMRGAAFVAAATKTDVVLTTYALALLDQQQFADVAWNVICLDEAQHIKNPHAKQTLAIGKLSARHRVVMTGTPLENRLTELWSLFHFLSPGYLGSLRSFTDRFAIPVEKQGETAPLEGLRRLTQPFMLRRSKLDPAVELDLPEKAEMKVYVQLTAEQAALYEQVLAQMIERLDTLSPMERRGVIIGTLSKLKQVCDHPALFYKEEKLREGWTGRSVKMTRLLDMVRELRAEGDRCLVFTQFVGMGERLQMALERELGESVLFLHGGLTKTQRDVLIEQFQVGDERSPGVFILSLKAGGVGLNLTAANHVFHFDRWWNPAVEQQATDRAFRIGQTRRVQVHKFIALGTVEERIGEVLTRKPALGEQVLGSGEQWLSELSTAELHDLFALRREWVQ